MLNNNLVVIDFETTGLSPQRGDRITEVAAVRVQRDKLVDRFESLVNCGVKIPPFITAYTGITQAMVDRAPRARSVIPQLLAFIGNDPIVAHNASFDRRFLESECAHSGQSAKLDTFICSMRVARRVYPSLTSHALESLAQQLGVAYRGTAHRAGADAEVTANIMVLVGRQLESKYTGLSVDAALLRRIMKMPVAAAAKRLKVLALAEC